MTHRGKSARNEGIPDSPAAITSHPGPDQTKQRDENVMEVNPEEDGKTLISCPGCGHSMTMGEEGEGCLTCPNGHTYTLETLLLGQSLRVETLIHAAIQFLHQQECLVRGLAQQMWESQSVTAFRLEGQADRISATITRLRAILKERETPETKSAVSGY